MKQTLITDLAEKISVIGRMSGSERVSSEWVVGAEEERELNPPCQ